MPRKVIKISREQIRALSNPRRLDIHTSLRTDGPATAKELAARLGAEENRLYYHLRLLSSLGLITCRTQEGTTKPETVYSVEARYLVEGFDLTKQTDLKEQCRNVDSLLRAASKEHRLAVQNLKNDVHDRMFVGRSAVRLNQKDFKELRRKLKDLNEWLDKNSDSKGARYSVSLFAFPLLETGS